MKKEKIKDCINILNKVSNWNDELVRIKIDEVYKELKWLEDIYDEIMDYKE